MSDVVTSSAPRTYLIPRSVQRSAGVAADATGAEVWAAGILVQGGAATAEMVEILTAVHASGPFLQWAPKVLKSAVYDQQQAITAALEMVGFDPEHYTYLGICDAAEPDVIRTLVRVGANPEAWDWWAPGREWQSVPPEQIAGYEAYELDPELVGFTADALAYADGILFRFTTPGARLPHDPVLSESVLAAAGPDQDHFYAIVDSTDPSAVLDVVAIRPGPVVHLRQGGEWLPSPGTLERLTTMNPPPLVELDDESLQLVLAQMDDTVVQAETKPENVESVGHEDEIESGTGEEEPESEAAEPVAASGSDPVTDYQRRIETTYRIDEIMRSRYEARVAGLRAEDDQQGLIAAMAAESSRRLKVDAEIEGLTHELYAVQLAGRRAGYEYAVAAGAKMRTRVAALETLAGRMPVTAVRLDRSRRYWLKGIGNVALAWCAWGDEL